MCFLIEGKYLTRLHLNIKLVTNFTRTQKLPLKAPEPIPLISNQFTCISLISSLNVIYRTYSSSSSSNSPLLLITASHGLVNNHSVWLSSSIITSGATVGKKSVVLKMILLHLPLFDAFYYFGDVQIWLVRVLVYWCWKRVILSIITIIPNQF